jgi:hypothetical protein
LLSEKRAVGKGGIKPKIRDEILEDAAVLGEPQK